MRIVCYMRYSSHQQDDGYSIESQREKNMDYITRNHYILTDEYIDTAKTAKRVAGRENFDRMLNDAKLGLFDAVLVWKFSRVFRNLYEAQYYRRYLKKYNVKLLSATQDVDDSTSHGRLMLNMLHSIDEYQSDTIADHVSATMHTLAKRCLYLGGPAPLGFRPEPVDPKNKKAGKMLQPYEPEAETIRTIFRLYDQGFSLSMIRDYLRDNGMYSRKGNVLAPASLSKFLHDDIYIGTYRWSSQEYEDVIVPEGLTPIIERDLWDRVHMRLNEKPEMLPRKRKRRYLLTGKMICRCCNNNYFGSMNRSTYKGQKFEYRTYICRGKKAKNICKAKNIKKEHIEGWILDEIRQHILTPEAQEIIIESILAKAREKDKQQPEHDLMALQKRKSELVHFLGELVEKEMLGKISEDVRISLSAKYDAELKQVNKDIMRAEQALKKGLSRESVEKYLKQLLSHSDKASEDALQLLFDAVVKRVTATDETIELLLIVSPLNYPIEDMLPEGSSLGSLPPNLEDKLFKGLPIYALSSKIKRITMERRYKQ